MEEILVAIVQFLFEFIVNALANVPLEWGSKNRRTPEPERITWRCFLWFCGGCLLAGASLLVFKQTLITVPALRIVNLLLAPIVSGLVSQAIAKRRSSENKFIIPRNHFWQAFWFTLGLVIIRFAYATRL